MIKYEANIHQGHNFKTYALCDAWIQRTHANLIAAGCVQTADTGQYTENLGTELPPESNLGYRIYEINDAYSGTVPVYIRLDFFCMRMGTASTDQRGPRLTTTVGFGTDGAGTLTSGSIQRGKKTYITASSASANPLFNPNARTFTSKGDGFLVHGNELVAGIQGTSNTIDGGFFAVVRSKVDGVTNPETVTFIYSEAGVVWGQGEVLKYTRITKNIGVSAENMHIFRLPRIRSTQDLVVATTADISESNQIEHTDCLIAFRTSTDDSPWSTHTLSLDGLTEKTYLQLPHPLAGNQPVLAMEKITTTIITDSLDPYLGAIGVLIGE